MPVTDSFVQVAADGPGKKIDNVEVTTTEGPVERQVIVLADPEDPDARATIKNGLPAFDAYGLAVRKPLPAVNLGPFAFTNVLTAALGATVYGTFLWLHNLSSAIQEYTITDGNDVFYADRAPIGPREVIPIPLHNMRFENGIKFKVENTGMVQGHFVGDLEA